MKKITVLLTKYSDWNSSLIFYLTGRKYTHASLGIDGTYYSFNYKGFHKETTAFHRKHGVKQSLLYEVSVPDVSYQYICNQVQYFEQHKELFHYNVLGVVLCFFHIPFNRKEHYFCSQFVAEMLKKSGAVALKKRAELYFPNHLLQELAHSSQVTNVQLNPI